MSDQLRKELKQSKPFASLQEEAVLNIARTASVLERQLTEVLKKADLSLTQYNVLRILKGAGQKGLPCNEVAERLVTHDPDVTRLVDRMEKRGLVSRLRSSQDRRVVKVIITGAGSHLAGKLANPVGQLLKKQLHALNEKKLEELIEALELIRQEAAAPE